MELLDMVVLFLIFKKTPYCFTQCGGSCSTPSMVPFLHILAKLTLWFLDTSRLNGCEALTIFLSHDWDLVLLGKLLHSIALSVLYSRPCPWSWLEHSSAFENCCCFLPFSLLKFLGSVYSNLLLSNHRSHLFGLIVHFCFRVYCIYLYFYPVNQDDVFSLLVLSPIC